jgi:undecaprenyl-diphosphatase
MNPLDRGLLLGLNQFAHRSRIFDAFVVQLSVTDLLKGGVALGVIWWLWFSTRDDLRSVRARLLATLAAGALAALAGRLLADTLPFRTRPFHEPQLPFRLPYTEGLEQLRDFSSFPSDHALLFTALSVGVMFASRRAGIFLLIWSFIVVLLPRLYMGLHYPTDLLAGAAIGALIACLLQMRGPRERLARPLLGWLDRHPSSFYAAMFLASLQIGTLFSDVRALLALLARALYLRSI